MGRKPLFTKQRVLSVIRSWIVHRGMPPTIEELRQELGAGSKRTVLRYLDQLEQDGLIERWSGARGMRLGRSPDQGTGTVSVPVLGVVPAGTPTLAEENILGHVRLPASLVGKSKGTFFLLRVSGDSMDLATVSGSKIEQGDLVFVRQQASAENGDVVVALIDGEATVKKLVRGPNYTLLQPQSSNSLHQPIMVGEDAAVLGVVTAVFKEGAQLLDDTTITS